MHWFCEVQRSGWFWNRQHTIMLTLVNGDVVVEQHWLPGPSGRSLGRAKQIVQQWSEEHDAIPGRLWDAEELSLTY